MADRGRKTVFANPFIQLYNFYNPGELGLNIAVMECADTSKEMDKHQAKLKGPVIEIYDIHFLPFFN